MVHCDIRHAQLGPHLRRPRCAAGHLGPLQNLLEAVSTTDKLANGALQGTNDFGKIGYGGPAPPPGKPHRYFFKLYALDDILPLPAGSTKSQLVNAMKGHVLDEGELMGTYQR
jgi:Raf kinase inhibitor-like YbhB/YbcL family protein